MQVEKNSYLSLSCKSYTIQDGFVKLFLVLLTMTLLSLYNPLKSLYLVKRNTKVKCLKSIVKTFMHSTKHLRHFCFV